MSNRLFTGTRIIVTGDCKTKGRIGTVLYPMNMWMTCSVRLDATDDKPACNISIYKENVKPFKEMDKEVKGIPEKVPTAYKVGCAEIKQVLQQVFESEEEALKTLYDWSLRLGGKTCQLLTVHSEYKAQLNPKLVKVD